MEINDWFTFTFQIFCDILKLKCFMKKLCFRQLLWEVKMLSTSGNLKVVVYWTDIHCNIFFFYFLASTTAPESALKWSLPETWQDVGEGWGGHNHTIPGPGDDVLILPSEWNDPWDWAMSELPVDYISFMPHNTVIRVEICSLLFLTWWRSILL